MRSIGISALQRTKMLHLSTLYYIFCKSKRHFIKNTDEFARIDCYLPIAPVMIFITFAQPFAAPEDSIFFV